MNPGTCHLGPCDVVMSLHRKLLTRPSPGPAAQQPPPSQSAPPLRPHAPLPEDPLKGSPSSFVSRAASPPQQRDFDLHEQDFSDFRHVSRNFYPRKEQAPGSSEGLRAPAGCPWSVRGGTGQGPRGWLVVQGTDLGLNLGTATYALCDLTCYDSVSQLGYGD